MRIIADSAPAHRLREYNQNHEPAGSPIGGRFARSDGGSGSVHDRGAAARNIASNQIRTQSPGDAVRDRVAKVDPQKRLDYATDRINRVQDHFANDPGELAKRAQRNAASNAELERHMSRSPEQIRAESRAKYGDRSGVGPDGRALQSPTPSAAGLNFKAFVDKSVQNMQATSRTAKGVSDTSSSADKPKLNTEGDALAAKADTNFRNALTEAWNAKDHQFGSPDEVVQFAEHIASTVSNGLLQPGQDLYRTWETKNNQTTPSEIKPQMQQFGQALFTRLQNDPDPVGTAAWVEKEMAKLHPWADGVGRTTKVLSAYVLARAGLELPTYPDKKTYYKEVLKSAPEWDAYFRSMFTNSPAKEARWVSRSRVPLFTLRS